MVTLFTFVDVFFGIVILYPGLEEELAEAIDQDFYDSYKTWTLDNVHAPSSQKVCVSDKNKIYNLYPDSSVG